MRRRDIGVIEVLRTDRRERLLRGKSDTIDAENAAQAVLNHTVTSVPKTNDGVVEMIRQIEVAKDVAAKTRTAAVITLRELLQPLSKMALIQRCAGLRPGDIDTVTVATKHTLRSIAQRWQRLNDEMETYEALLAKLTAQLVPQLVAAFGIDADTGSEHELSTASPWLGRPFQAARPAEQPLRPGQQLVVAERLDQVVIGAGG